MDNALKMYTVNAAYSVNNEANNGSLEIGKFADMVIIDRDPYKYAHTRDIYDIRVIKTIKSGRIIFDSGL